MFYHNRTYDPSRPMVELRGVSKHVNLERLPRRSLQERFIRLFHRQAQDERALFWPLRNVDLTIRRGEALGLIGPNGAGKSTMLKLITGIVEPDEGEVWVNGRLSSLLELGAGFHPDLTGRENIFLNASIYGLRGHEIEARLDEIIDFSELGPFIDMPVKHYSSGMYVRLGFAVAIHTDPELLLVDEVLAVGDAAFQAKCLRAIERFREGGGTLVFISHDLGTVQSICTRALWLEDGRIQAEGGPTEVVMEYTAHVNAREAQKAERQGDRSSIRRPQRWGTGRVRIAQVEICDGAGRPSSVFRTGDTLLVRMRYETDERVDTPVFGVGLNHQNGTHISGPNTRFAAVDIPFIEGSGIVTYRVDDLPLMEGSYVMSVAATDAADSETYDYHDRLYSFQVFRGDSRERYGLVTLRGGWSLDGGPDSSAGPGGAVQPVSKELLQRT